MGKQGPCCHCGATSTPLWRNGPPGKPVLCNACGSRWRTKGTLVNYTPGYTREERKPQLKKVSAHALNPHISSQGSSEDKATEQKNGALTVGSDDETSSGSSSESGMSGSGKCVQLGSVDCMDASGCIPMSIHHFPIPRRKRTARIYYTPTPVEHLQKSLFEVMRDQEFSTLTESAEDVLIYECQNPLSWPEVGLGTILIKPPISSAEEESVGSSLILENRIHSFKDTHVAAPNISEHSQSGKTTNLGVQGGHTPHQWTPSKLLKNFLSSVHNPDARWSSHSAQRNTQTDLSSEILKLEKEILSESSLGCQILHPTNTQLSPAGFEKYQGTSLPTKIPLGLPSFQKSGVDNESSGCFSLAVGAVNLSAVVRPFGPPSFQSSGAEKQTSLRSCCTLGAETPLPCKRPLERPNSEASPGIHGCWTAEHHRWTSRRPPVNPSSFKDLQSGQIDRDPSGYVHSSKSYSNARYATDFPAEKIEKEISGGATSNEFSLPEESLSLLIRKEDTKQEKTRGAISCTHTACSPQRLL
ncbi:hypothetical protein H6P81_010363 [Aristolochia fimbriata]|uniref:GATA-type domain-containing protein n=1 Tax=Aristolochia fimbriata TaxID=158543 RepID=A0AAV7ENJ2_ARIFI|nr:hypothetical protein H6P81_010363 [Aristolochia fimbriata]